jgi:hypothetical protein
VKYRDNFTFCTETAQDYQELELFRRAFTKARMRKETWNSTDFILQKVALREAVGFAD